MQCCACVARALLCAVRLTVRAVRAAGAQAAACAGWLLASGAAAGAPALLARVTAGPSNTAAPMAISRCRLARSGFRADMVLRVIKGGQIINNDSFLRRRACSMNTRGQGGGLGLWAKPNNYGARGVAFKFRSLRRRKMNTGASERRDAQNERDGAGLRSSVAAATLSRQQLRRSSTTT